MAESEIGIPEETSGEVCNDVGGRNFSRIQDDYLGGWLSLFMAFV